MIDYILDLRKDQEFVTRWLNQWTDCMLIILMLDRGELETIEQIGFGRLEELAETFPILAKKLARPIED